MWNRRYLACTKLYPEKNKNVCFIVLTVNVLRTKLKNKLAYYHSVIVLCLVTAILHDAIEITRAMMNKDNGHFFGIIATLLLPSGLFVGLAASAAMGLLLAAAGFIALVGAVGTIEKPNP